MVWPFTSSREAAASIRARSARVPLCTPDTDPEIDLAESFSRRVGRWLKRIAIVTGCLALVAGLAAGGIYVHRFIYKTNYFRVREIRITGASEPLERDARARLTRKLASAGDNLVRLSRPVLMSELTRLPRAKQVRVFKVYPDTLQVSFTERRPMALANLDRLYQMDSEGVLLAAVTARDAAAQGLPLITGLKDPSAGPGTRIALPRLAEVLEAIQFINSSDPLLLDQIREWNMADRGQVTAILRKGTEVRFGTEPLLELLPTLSAGLDQKKSLQHAAYIDLRMDKQLVYKPEGPTQP
jgi:cell division septal protein FtsQ